MESVGLFVLLSLITNPQNNTEKCDVIAPKTRRGAVYFQHIEFHTVFTVVFRGSNVSAKLDVRRW